MKLGELIDLLKTVPQDKVLLHGFKNPHSWRGIYRELAFEPTENISVGEMLKTAESAVGTTYTGYKGGEFTMDLGTPIRISPKGKAEDSLEEILCALQSPMPMPKPMLRVAKGRPIVVLDCGCWKIFLPGEVPFLLCMGHEEVKR